MSEWEVIVCLGLEMTKKPVIDAGETTLLLCAGYMESETAQMGMPERGMLGVLERLIHRDDAFARLESEVAVLRHVNTSTRLSIYFIIRVYIHMKLVLRYQEYNIDSSQGDSRQT